MSRAQRVSLSIIACGVLFVYGSLAIGLAINGELPSVRFAGTGLLVALVGAVGLILSSLFRGAQ